MEFDENSLKMQLYREKSYNIWQQNHIRQIEKFLWEMRERVWKLEDEIREARK